MESNKSNTPPPSVMSEEYGIDEFAGHQEEGETDTAFLEAEDDIPQPVVTGVDRMSQASAASKFGNVPVVEKMERKAKAYKPEPDEIYLNYLADHIREEYADLTLVVNSFYPFQDPIAYKAQDYISLGFLEATGQFTLAFLTATGAVESLSPDDLIEELSELDPQLPHEDNERLVSVVLRGLTDAIKHIKWQQETYTPPVIKPAPTAAQAPATTAPEASPKIDHNPAPSPGQSDFFTKPLTRHIPKANPEPFELPMDEPVPQPVPTPQHSQPSALPVTVPPVNYEEQLARLNQSMSDGFRQIQDGLGDRFKLVQEGLGRLQQNLSDIRAKTGEGDSGGQAKALDNLGHQLQGISQLLEKGAGSFGQPPIPPQHLKAIQDNLGHLEGLVETHTKLIAKQTNEYANLPAFISKKTWGISVAIAGLFFLLTVLFAWLYIDTRETNKIYRINFLKYNYLRDKAVIQGGSAVFKPAYDEVEKVYHSSEFEKEFETAKLAREAQNAQEKPDEQNQNDQQGNGKK